MTTLVMMTLSSLKTVLVYRNGSECCLGEAGDCCYDENKKGRLKELKMTHGAHLKPENTVMTRNV